MAGRVLLAGSGSAVQDDTVIGNVGMGGQGILPVPIAYNGWVQQWVANCTTSDCNAWKGPGGTWDRSCGDICETA